MGSNELILIAALLAFLVALAFITNGDSDYYTPDAPQDITQEY